MEFAIAIHKDPDSDYGVSVPDIEGCFSSGDTIKAAIQNTREAIEFHVAGLYEEGLEVNLSTTPIELLRRKQDYEGALWAVVDIDLDKLDNKPERVNISLPRFVLKKIDDQAEKHKETRSGFLARAALDAIERENAHA